MFDKFDNSSLYCILECEELYEYCVNEYPTEFKTYTDTIRYAGSVKRSVGKYRDFVNTSLYKQCEKWYTNNVGNDFTFCTLHAYELEPGAGRMVPHRDMPHQSVTMLVHLNENWIGSNGGEFVIYDTPNKKHKNIMEQSIAYEASDTEKPFAYADEWNDLRSTLNIPTEIYKTDVNDKSFVSIRPFTWHGSAPVSNLAQENRRTVHLTFYNERQNTLNKMNCFSSKSRVVRIKEYND